MRVHFAAAAIVLAASVTAYADPLKCNLTEYKAAAGLAATLADDTLTLTWDGERNEEVRLRLVLTRGTPTIRELSVRRKDAGQWNVLASNATPEFSVASGLRRATDQQLRPLRDLGVPITPEVIDRIKWEAFWDAPLNVPGGDAAHGGSTPPLEGVAGQPGLPRKPEEVTRASAAYQVQSCDVKTNGMRIEVSFPGVQLGVFTGRLQYTIYKGTSLIRQEIVAKTDAPSVAYKYDAGLSALAIRPASRIVWRDTANTWQDYAFGSAKHDGPVVLKAANRLVVAEEQGGSIAAFPPPHNFFWARETENVLGYNWYRKDTDSAYSFGVRQAESEEEPAYAGRGPEDRHQNFALRSARPGTWQRLAVYLYVTAEPGRAAFESALAFTRGDRFKPLPGYQVMATHFHTGFVRRLRASGSLDTRLPDLDVMKNAGINIFAPIDGAGGAARAAGVDRLKNQADYYQAARRHSDKTFLIMPNEEVMAANLGGHNDLLISKPLFWTPTRAEGQPFVEQHPTYGTVYHVGGPADMMEMATRENAIIYMPHPRSKGSTGYPDAIKDTAHFRHGNYRGVGFRWGMGLDGSEQRLCEYRCMPLFDDMNNWVADVQTPPKYLQAITETYEQGHGDDVYANNPVNYVKLTALPGPNDWTPIVDSMKRGDYFVTSGEVLISAYAVQGAGNQRTITAEVEWTFPLEFAEVVWGDGQKTDRQIIAATDLPPFGKHRFQIPFNVAGKKWVRFAVWDSAGNGAFVQPIKLPVPTTTTVSGPQ